MSEAKRKVLFCRKMLVISHFALYSCVKRLSYRLHCGNLQPCQTSNCYIFPPSGLPLVLKFLLKIFMSLKVLKNHNLSLNSWKTVTCIQKDLNASNPMYCRGTQERSWTQYCFAPGIGNPALGSRICWSGQRSNVNVL